MSKAPLPRSIAKILNFHLNTMPAVVLSGARQTGKSTLAKDIGQDTRKFYSLDDINVLDMAQNDPKSLISESGLITLDEIQREPKLLLAVKHDIDLNRQPGRFLLTGSANLLLMQKVSESLAGRASYLNLWPLARREQLGQGSCGIWEQLIGNDERTWIDVIAAEKTDMEDWRSFARRGGFPVPAIHQTTVEERQIWFNGYMQTYLERDLQQLSVISALPDFQRLVRAICLRLGGLSNQTDLSRDTSIPQPTVHRYLNLLETSCLLVRLTPYFVNRTKRLVKSPKLYWCDVGMALHIAGQNEPNGVHLENIVLQDLLTWRAGRIDRAEIHYWRTTLGEEVDFIIETGGRVLPIEVKVSKQPHIGDAAKLRVFRREYGNLARSGLLLHTGDKMAWLTDDVLAVPWWRVI